MNESTPALGKVIKIDERSIQDHLGHVVRSTVEETLNGCWMRKRIGFAGQRVTSAVRPGGTTGRATTSAISIHARGKCG